jgi:hypothetical protein
MIAAAAAQAIHRNLMRSAISAPAPPSSSERPSRTAASALNFAAPALSPSRMRAIRRENSAGAAVGYLIRQQGQPCEGHGQ